jgi:uroporphyrin-III C-methyltransferase
LAVPASQNIPVTKRGSAESFWVITGTTKEHKISSDIELAAKSNATIVVLMGMSKLPQIVKLFQAEGKNNLPVAIIQNGTRFDEKIGIGTLDTIENIVAEKELKNPAIIVLGEVVKHRQTILEIQQQFKTEIAN